MLIMNDIPRKQKVYFIRPSRYHLFGTDFEERDCMSDEEAVGRFDQTWDAKIRSAILDGDPVEYDDVLGLIAEHSRGYCNRDQEHRKFRLEGTVFVAQIKRTGESHSHNQLWPVLAKNYDTRTLFVTFQSQDERTEWNRLAARLGHDPEELGLRALRAFLLAFSAAQQPAAPDGAAVPRKLGTAPRG
ncbi:hypothetical protein ACSRUE_11055 [Sorangium sp. KYC3313]|uniref:hypothetical protein n=1 Tax=Sorangium sp. KYC3313 TaxID=3449740 RepID=UPI003F88D108